MALNLIPLAGQSLDETRDPIHDNFAFINTGFLANHVELNTGADSGKHKAVIMVNQTNAPTAPFTLGGESAIYSAPSLVAPNAAAIFIKNGASATTVNGIELTYALKATNGWTQLPSGLFLFWGTDTISAANPGTLVTYARAGGFPTATLNITVSILSAEAGNKSRTITIHDFNSTSFHAYAMSSGNITTSEIFYSAIGY